MTILYEGDIHPGKVVVEFDRNGRSFRYVFYADTEAKAGLAVGSLTKIARSINDDILVCDDLVGDFSNVPEEEQRKLEFLLKSERTHLESSHTKKDGVLNGLATSYNKKTGLLICTQYSNGKEIAETRFVTDYDYGKEIVRADSFKDLGIEIAVMETLDINEWDFNPPEIL